MIYDTDGESAGERELPPVFETPLRPDLIRRAVLAAQANRKQKQGADPYAGLRTSAESPGSGRGIAHVPRSNNQGARVPQTVGGRSAHPPKAEADPTLSVNEKERKQATRSAVAATADAELVAGRGHEFDVEEVPVVVEDGFADIEKTREVVAFLEQVGLHADVERADDARTVRAGQGTTRGRKYDEPTSVLFVTHGDAGPARAARNLAGADVATASNVNVEDLAPGTQPGRLTVWTESALEEVNGR